jgi:hypothetical protein
MRFTSQQQEKELNKWTTTRTALSTQYQIECMHEWDQDIAVRSMRVRIGDFHFLPPYLLLDTTQ